MEPITDKDLYIDDGSELEISWISEVEDQLRGSLTDRPLTGSLTKSTLSECEKEELIETSDQIINLDVNSLEDLKILEYQNILMTDILKTKNVLDKLTYLEWIRDGAKKLSDKLKLKMYDHKKEGLTRSSYKFCDYNYQCKFNYNLKKHTGCLFQHFVHNMVCADINSLLKFLNIGKINDNDRGDIVKTLKTLSFVLSHMHDELNNVFLFNSDLGIDLHVERSPKSDGKKKKKKKNHSKQSTSGKP